MVTIGDRIKQRRTAIKLSQQELGRRVGVSRAAVSQWENGDTKGLRPVNLVAAAKTLHCAVEWLVTGDQQPEPASFPMNTAPAEPVRFKTIDPVLLRQILDVVDEHIGRDSSDNQAIANWMADGYADYMRTMAADTAQIKRIVSQAINTDEARKHAGGGTREVRHE